MFNKRKMTFQLVDHSIDLFSSRRLSDTYVMQRIYRIAGEYDIEIKQITSKSDWDVTFNIKATAQKDIWRRFVRNLIDDLHGEIKNIHC